MTRPAPRWLTEATAWAGILVLIGGLVGAFSIDGERPLATPAAQAETPAVEEVREVVTRVPVQPKKQVPAKPKANKPDPSLVPTLGPPPGPQYDAPPAKVAAPAARYAFLVGITDYRSPTKDTIGSANDVRFIAAMLEARGWLPENIKVLTDRQVTGAAVRNGLTWLTAQSKPGTFTFFHYSGHVKQVGSTVKLWPVDRDFIPEVEMARLLSGGTGKMWVDIAGCEAGGFAVNLPSERVLFTASSTEAQKSYEYPQWGMSVWTGLLFDLSTGQGAADADKNGKVTMGEALRYSTYYAQAITLNQRPYGRQTPQAAGDPVRGWTLDAPPA